MVMVQPLIVVGGLFKIDDMLHTRRLFSSPYTFYLMVPPGFQTATTKLPHSNNQDQCDTNVYTYVWDEYNLSNWWKQCHTWVVEMA